MLTLAAIADTGSTVSDVATAVIVTAAALAWLVGSWINGKDQS